MLKCNINDLSHWQQPYCPQHWASPNVHCTEFITDWQTMENYIQQTGNAHINCEYIVIIRVSTQRVQVVLWTSTTLAQHCACYVCLLALALTSASLSAAAGNLFRARDRWDFPEQLVGRSDNRKPQHDWGCILVQSEEGVSVHPPEINF